jgi:hypothetical protein
VYDANTAATKIKRRTRKRRDRIGEGKLEVSPRPLNGPLLALGSVISGHLAAYLLASAGSCIRKYAD